MTNQHKKKHNNYKKKTLSLAVAGLALTAGVHAETDTSDQSFYIEEVVVTAQKRVENLQDAPIAISAFSADTLEDLGAHNVIDVGEYTPNVTIGETMGSNANITVGIRGLSSAEPSLTVDPKVGLYLDGVYIARNAGAIFNVVDLERIEVMRGPQGTLWGKNTTGGAISLVTAKPKGELAFKQLLSTGNRGALRSLSTLDTPAVGGVSAKISYLRKEHDGVAKNIHPDGPSSLGTDDTEAYRLAVHWAVTDELSADYSYDRTNAEGVPAPFQITAVNPIHAAAPGAMDVTTGAILFGVNPHNEMQAVVSADKRLSTFNLDNTGPEYVDIEGHNLTLSWSVGDLELKSISAYREYDSDISAGLDLDGGAWTIPVMHTGGIKSQQQFSQEFQAVGQALDGKLDYVLGLYHFEEDGQEENAWVTTLRNPLSPLLLHNVPTGNWYTVNSKSTAAYGQFSYTPEWLESNLRFTLGLRYTKDAKEVVLLDTDPRLPMNLEAAADWKNFSPTFTVDYQLSNDIKLYGKLAEGYNAGVFNPRAIDPSNPTDATQFQTPTDEENVSSFELGMKSEWLNRRLRLNVAAFYNEYKDLLVQDFMGNVSVTRNAGEAEASGIELELVAMPLPGLMVDAAYGYLNKEFSKFVVSGSDVADSAGSVAPENTARLGVGYTFPVWGIGQLNTRIDATYTDEHGFTALNYKRVAADERTLLNARVTLSDIDVGAGDLRVSLWGKNLTNKEYRMYGTDFGYNGALGYAGNLYGELRSYGVDFIYEF